MEVISFAEFIYIVIPLQLNQIVKQKLKYLTFEIYKNKALPNMRFLNHFSMILFIIHLTTVSDLS